jgi:hypothetical protein
MHFICLEKHCSLFIIQHFSVALECMLAEPKEVSLIIKKDSCRCLLIIGVVTWIEDFNARLLPWLY